MSIGHNLNIGALHIIQIDITFADNGLTKTVGTIPAGSVVLGGGVAVTTAFNAGTSNVLDIGTSADPDGFATDLALGTIGVIAADEMATTNDQLAAADVTVVAVPALGGTAATAGAARVWVQYLPPIAT